MLLYNTDNGRNFVYSLKLYVVNLVEIVSEIFLIFY